MPLPQPRPNPLIEPFRDALRNYKMITFVHVEPGGLGGGRCGEVIATDSDGAYILLDDGCTEGEYAATLGHEIAHLLNPDEDDEERIEARAAELLVPLHEAATARTPEQVRAVAARYGVDPKMVRARIRCADSRDSVGQERPPPLRQAG